MERRTLNDNTTLNTMYVGGGTPTALNIEQLNKYYQQLIEFSLLKVNLVLKQTLMN